MFTVPAIYRNGRIELLEKPPLKKDVKVLVVFPEIDKTSDLLEDRIQFQGTKEMDSILENESSWKPTTYIKRNK